MNQMVDLKLMILSYRQKVVTLVNVYAPNVDTPSSFDQLIAIELQNLTSELLILCGDFNFVFNINFNKKGETLELNLKL